MSKRMRKVYDHMKPKAEDDFMEAMQRLEYYIGDVPNAIHQQKSNGSSMEPINKILTDIVMEQHIALNSLEELYWGLKSEVIEYYTDTKQIANLTGDFIDDVNSCEEAVVSLHKQLTDEGLIK